MSQEFKAKFIASMLDGDTFDPSVEAMTPQARKKLIPAGDEIEDVLTKTLAVLANNPDIQVRGLDVPKTQRAIARLTRFEKLTTLNIALTKLLRDQERVLEDQLQREANNINDEIKRYTDDDTVLAADLKPFTDYMTRAQVTRKRNRALLDAALQESDPKDPKP